MSRPTLAPRPARRLVGTRRSGRRFVPTFQALEQRQLLANLAGFVGSDRVTQGNWIGTYGAEGSRIIGDATNDPAYATVSASDNVPFLWTASTTDQRAPWKAGPTGDDRIAACWYSNTSFDIDVQLNDGQTHQLAVYALDWDNYGRSERIDVLDPDTGDILDTRELSAFTGGVYTAWNVSGHVRLHFTLTGSANAAISGLFFDATRPAIPTALIATEADRHQIDLAWDASADATGYDVERSLNGTDGWTLIATTPAEATTYQDAGLAVGTTYFYRVRAVNANGGSPLSGVASAVTSFADVSFVGTDTTTQGYRTTSPVIP